MTTFIDLKKKFEALNTDKIITKIMDDTQVQLLEENKEQMYDGKLKTGGNITPSYLEDPYFKSRESAQRYSDWKDRITPNPERESGVPNLFINGKFYDSLKID